MSKKHFIAIAAEIRTQLDAVSNDYPSEVEGSARLAVIQTTERLCNVFADENPRFDRVRFLAACGINR